MSAAWYAYCVSLRNITPYKQPRRLTNADVAIGGEKMISILCVRNKLLIIAKQR